MIFYICYTLYIDKLVTSVSNVVWHIFYIWDETPKHNQFSSPVAQVS